MDLIWNQNILDICRYIIFKLCLCLLKITSVVNCYNLSIGYNRGNLLRASDEHVGTLFNKTWENGCWIGSKKGTTICVQNWMYVKNIKKKKISSSQTLLKKITGRIFDLSVQCHLEPVYRNTNDAVSYIWRVCSVIVDFVENRGKFRSYSYCESIKFYC